MGGNSLTIANRSAKRVRNDPGLPQFLFNGIVEEFGLAAELVGAFKETRELVLEVPHPVHATPAA